MCSLIRAYIFVKIATVLGLRQPVISCSFKLTVEFWRFPGRIGKHKMMLFFYGEENGKWNPGSLYIFLVSGLVFLFKKCRAIVEALHGMLTLGT